jgi:hypothetical protein
MKYPKSLKRNSKKRKTLTRKRKTLTRKPRKVYEAPKEKVRVLSKRVVNTYIYRPPKK